MSFRQATRIAITRAPALAQPRIALATVRVTPLVTCGEHIERSKLTHSELTPILAHRILDLLVSRRQGTRLTPRATHRPAPPDRLLRSPKAPVRASALELS